MHNKNENCEAIMEQYLSLDKDERVPLHISMHLLFCKKCRSQIKLLKAAEKVCASPIFIATPVNDQSIETIMQKIAPETYKNYTKKSRSLHTLIIPVMMFIPSIFTTSAMNSDALSLFYALLIAICIAVYCCVFALCNIDMFVKKISARVKV